MSVTLTNPYYLLIWLAIPFVWYMVYLPTVRQQGTIRNLTSASMRSLVILLMGVTLAQPRLHHGADGVNLFFVVDASDSVFHAGENVARSYIEKAVRAMKEEDRAGLIRFGKKSSLEVPLTPNFPTEFHRSHINSKFTNIYEGLQLAVGKLPDQGTNRILLISDGNQNLKQAEEIAFLAKSLNIQIFSLSLESQQEKNEVRIEGIETPSLVALQSPFEVHIRVVSAKESEGDLILLRNGELIANHTIPLLPGKNVFRLIDVVHTPGIYSYKAVINPKEDVVYQNNEGLSFTSAIRKSGVLYLSESGASKVPLVIALREQGFHLDVLKVQDLPASMNDIIDYKAIILDNVPSTQLSEQDMENLEKFVKDVGGGLLMIGGPQSFGAGEYRKTPVERALPVLMDPPTELVYSSLSIIFVIDKSTSMVKNLGSQKKLEAAKIAVFSAVELLNPKDMVGVIAFDANYQWTVPFTSAKNRKTIARSLLSLKADGGTKLFQGLQEAIATIQTHASIKKHVIILSDGEIFDAATEKERLNTLLNTAVEKEITISTVAVGEDANYSFMKNMADRGKGRSYRTNDAGNIPRIFVDEIKIVSRKVILEEELQPELEHYSDFMEGYEDSDFPPVLGMDITYPKPEATIQLKTREGPLLVTKRYGLGKSLAFTSDLSGRWGKQWLQWDNYGPFAGRMVKWVEKNETAGQYDVLIEKVDDQGHFLVDVTDQENRFINNLELKIKVLFPNQTQSNEEIALEQIAPGKYKGIFPVEETGAYYLNLYELKAEKVVNSQTFGYGIPYTSEFQNLKTNTNLLNQLAHITGGRILHPEEDLSPLFNVEGDVSNRGVPLWPYFLFASCFLLIVEVALRKLFEIGRFRVKLEEEPIP